MGFSKLQFFIHSINTHINVPCDMWDWMLRDWEAAQKAVIKAKHEQILDYVLKSDFKPIKLFHSIQWAVYGTP